MIKEYPRWVYHVVEEPVLAKDADEVQYYLERGWTIDPKIFSEKEALLAKIRYYQAELERLTQVYTQMVSDSQRKEIPKAIYQAPVVEVTLASENTPESAPEKEIVTSPRRGRPRKV